MAHANHEYHLVNPSPWPAVGATSAFILAVGAIAWMHSISWGALATGVGLIGVLYTMLDVVVGRHQGGAARRPHAGRQIAPPLRHDPVHRLRGDVLRRLVLGLFQRRAVSRRGASRFARTALTGGVWPPKGIETFDPWHLPLLNTLILLTSGTTVTWAHHALIEGDQQGVKNGLMLHHPARHAVHLCQAYEYSHAAFDFAGNIYGATFFMATGFHGFHVIIGTIFLIVCLSGPIAASSRRHHLGFEFAAWYWHFVDVVWLFLFACIYVWGHGGGAGAAH